MCGYMFYAAISYPEKTPCSFATHYAEMQKYGIILARQCALSDSCLLVLGIKKCTAMRRAFHPIARVLLSATSLRNVLTLSMCVRGNAEDKKRPLQWQGLCAYQSSYGLPYFAQLRGEYGSQLFPVKGGQRL